MSFIDEWDIYYTDNEQDEDMVDIIYIHKNNKEYYVHENAFDYEIDGCDEDMNELNSTYVSRFVYNTLLDQCKRAYKLSTYFDQQESDEEFVDLDTPSTLPIEKLKNRVLKEKIWQGINCELEESELEAITRQNHQKDEYFDLETCKKVIYKYLNNEITPEYFCTWCVFMANLHLSPNNIGGKLFDVNESISELFDSAAFWDYDIDIDEKIKNCKELIAELKWRNHCIENIKNKQTAPFDNNGIIVYVSFDHFNEYAGPIHRMCIVDTKEEKFNMFYIDNLEFDENINYSFCNEEDFDNLSGVYYSYKEDRYFAFDDVIKKLNK